MTTPKQSIREEFKEKVKKYCEYSGYKPSEIELWFTEPIMQAFDKTLIEIVKRIEEGKVDKKAREKMPSLSLENALGINAAKEEDIAIIKDVISTK